MTRWGMFARCECGRRVRVMGKCNKCYNREWHKNDREVEVYYD